MHKVNTKFPHVFLKHKNEKTHGKEQQERCGKKGWQLHGKAAQDGGRVETMVVGREGGLQVERHVDGERRVSLTRSLTRHISTPWASRAAVAMRFCTVKHHHSSPSFSSVFAFLWLPELDVVHCFS